MAMSKAEILDLEQGDTVFFHCLDGPGAPLFDERDRPNGRLKGSRRLKIDKIHFLGNCVFIEEPDGLMTFAMFYELDRPEPSLWKNNEVQFAMLLCNLMANWNEDARKIIPSACDSMKLTQEQFDELLARARSITENVK